MKNCILLIVAIIIILTAMTGCSTNSNTVSDPTIVKEHDMVQLNYIMKLEDGTILFDTREAGAPVELTLGTGNMLPAFEEAVVGMKVGEKKTIRIASDDAYGPHKQELVFDVPRSQLPDDQEPVAGMKLQREKPDGTIEVATIIAVSDDTVLVDTNNELAGKDLIFEIEVMHIL